MDNPLGLLLNRLPDGTVKQVNPFSGTEVWTVPGRADRPLGVPVGEARELDRSRYGQWCAFCESRYRETPPEKSRLVREFWGWRRIDEVSASELHDTVADFRRVPNLFEILSLAYWQANYGFQIPQAASQHRDRYLGDPAGREHVLAVVRQKLMAAGWTESRWQAMSDAEKLEHASGFFGGGHDVIIGRRHFADGATHDNQLASSGTLSVDEHAAYTNFTIESMLSLYENNPYARFVAVFQNWLNAAGASFDHLHKQLVAIDERGASVERALARQRQNYNLFNDYAVGYAMQNNLLIAENDHAIAYASVGNRFPTIAIYSTSEHCFPWEHSAEERQAMSDILHACHAATGQHVPCNEEWMYQPPDVDLPAPWRILLKWRISTLAGFEGGTKIYLNTIDPWQVRDKTVQRLHELRSHGRLAPGVRIAEECRLRPNPLRYNPNLRR